MSPLAPSLEEDGTTPSPPPPAANPGSSAVNLVHDSGQLVCVGDAFFACFVDGVGRNIGSGCASGVRGTTRLVDPAGGEIAAAEWTSADDLVEAGGWFTYHASYVGLSAMQREAIASWRSEFAWMEAACP